jgi:hypothetical protein
MFSPQPPTRYKETSLAPPERRSRRLPAALIATAAACLALVVQAPSAAADSAANATPQIGVLPFAGDVSTIGTNGSLIPVDPSLTPLSAPLFNLGGQPMNLTWGQFSSASATSLVRTAGNHTDFEIALSGLVPNGVYSLFYRTFGPDSANPVCGSTGVHDPLVALTAAKPERQQPDADSFVADSSGAAEFDGRVDARLLDAQQLQVVVIYHFDGNTYGPVPNRAESTDCGRSSYAIDAMRQLLIIQK